VANNEPMAVIGATYVILRVGGRSVESKIHITQNRKTLILGINWLTKQGRFNWDFDRGRIKFGEEDWIELQSERVVYHRTGKFGRREHRSLEEREFTPDQLWIWVLAPPTPLSFNAFNLRLFRMCVFCYPFLPCKWSDFAIFY